MSKITFTSSGLFKKSNLDNLSKELFKNINDSAKRELKEAFSSIKSDLEHDVRKNFKVKKQSFAKAFGKKLYDKRSDKLASMVVYAKLGKMMDAFESGAMISGLHGNLVIPSVKIKRDVFKKIVSFCHQEKSLFFKKRGDKILMMADVTKGNSTLLNKFKKYKRMTTGVKRIKQGDEVILGVMVKSVTLKKRLHLHQILDDYGPVIARKTIKNCKKIN